MSGLSAEAEHLLRDIDAADRRRAGSARITHKLERLATLAPQGSDAWYFATLRLCQQAACTRPWLAALLARQLIDQRPDEADGWAQLGLAQSQLGHHRYAARAYRKALARTPNDATIAHNLGHLYDVCFDDAERALPLLKRAHHRLQHPEVTASLAHALMRHGQHWEALALLKPLMRQPAPAHHHHLHELLLDRCRNSLPADTAPPPPAATARGRKLRRRRRTVTSSRTRHRAAASVRPPK